MPIALRSAASPLGLAVSVLVLLVAATAGLLVGPAGLPPAQVLLSLLSHLPLLHIRSSLGAADRAVVWDLRLPRVVLGAMVGWLLAMSGASYQGAFQNPLADPYLLGTAAGAGLGATLVIEYGPGTTGSWYADPLPLAAFGGGTVAVLVAYGLGVVSSRRRDPGTVVLAGVAVTFFFTALQTYFQQQHAQDLQQVYSWILGSLSGAGWHQVTLVLPYALISSLILLYHRRSLDVLSVGDAEATNLGLDVSRARLWVVIGSTLATAAAVAVSGLIGFVGLIVPHAVRLATRSGYRSIVPLSILNGAAFLVLADLAARTVASPAEIPIGVVTAFFGAPFFLLILRRAGR
jgi:iron complex transport system permease protein